MSSDELHIIRRVRAELHLPLACEKNKYAQDLEQAVPHAVESAAAELETSSDDGIHHIDSLSVELNVGLDEWDELAVKLDQALRKRFSKLNTSLQSLPSDQPEPENRNKDNQGRGLLLFFLQTGRMPWWTSGPKMEQLVHQIELIPAEEWKSFIHLEARRNPFVLKRLTLQFPIEVLRDCIRKTAGTVSQAEDLLQLIELIDRFGRSSDVRESRMERLIRESFYYAFRSLLLSKLSSADSQNLILVTLLGVLEKEDNQLQSKPITEQWNEWLRAREPEEIFKKFSISAKKDFFETDAIKLDDKPEIVRYEKDKDTPEWLLSCAGLILLHPFFQKLFENLGLMEYGHFRDDAARERATCLLAYLVYGEVEFPEYQLTLPKYLCGWPLEMPVNRFLSISDYEKDECHSVLQSAIRHWDVLKTTSPDGLREAFLKRPGILKKEAFGWTLFVEKETHDVLLDKIPWNLSLIKLQWLDHLLTVKWT